MSKSCRDKRIRDPEVELARAQNELIALNDEFSHLTLVQRIMRSSKYREKEVALMKRIRAAELEFSERKKRHGN